MKKTFLILTAVLLFSTAVHAQEGYYASVKGIFSATEGKLDGIKDDYENLGLGFAVGAKVNRNIRAELEIAVRGEDSVSSPYYGYDGVYSWEGVDKFSVSATSYMINGYYDFHNQSAFTPYVGLGIGMAKVKYENSWVESWYQSGAFLGTDSDIIKISKTKMVWNIALGASYKINDRLNLDLGYRHMDYGSFTTLGSKIETQANEFGLGLRYDF